MPNALNMLCASCRLYHALGIRHTRISPSFMLIDYQGRECMHVGIVSDHCVRLYEKGNNFIVVCIQMIGHQLSSGSYL